MNKKKKIKHAKKDPKVHTQKNRKEKNKGQKDLVCLPSSSQNSLTSGIFGYICRTLVIFCAVLGLTVFFGSTFELLTYQNLSFVMQSTLVCVLLISLMCLNKYCFWVGTLGFIVYTAILLSGIDQPILTLIKNSIITVSNAIFNRLHNAGYLSYIKFVIPIDSYADTASLAGFGLCIIMFLFALCFVLSLMRKTRIIPPLILSLLILVPVFVFNISQGRWGTALVIISFAAILTMNIFDKTYVKKIKESDIMVPCQDEDAAPQNSRTNIPDEVGTTDNSHTKKKARAKYSKEFRKKLSSRAAGGFAGFFMLVISFIVIFIPASAVDGAFETIPAFDKKMDVARKYVTAVLRGDDPILDLLEYQTDRDNFEPHSTDAKQLSFENKQLFYVETQYATNIYMRNWLGVNYNNGAWETANDTQLENYRNLFGTQNATSESLLYSFINYMRPSAIRDMNYGYDTKYTRNSNIGYITMAVNVRRLQKLPSAVCMPSYHIPDYGILEYGTLNEHESLTYINYFDGIYTGRNFKKSDIEYSFITNVQTLRGEDRNKYVSNMIADFNLMSEAFFINGNGRYTGYPELEITDDPNKDYIIFTYSYTDEGNNEKRTFIHKRRHISVNGLTYTISTDDNSTLKFYLLPSSKCQDASFIIGKGYGLSNPFEQYNSDFSPSQKSIFADYMSTYNDYIEFTYDTYTSKSNSQIISSISNDIYNSFIETTLNSAESYAADLKNSSEKDTYSQRDELVRFTIDYIIDTLGCKYTITPDTSRVYDSLDGVENFLTQTKEGYCVQYASAVTLILRELGIPARYNEGYIVCDFKQNTRNDAVGRYRAYVHDYEAHAWVEVWFDGIGWVQYETTPAYYSSMYGAKDPDDPDPPPYGPDPGITDDTTAPPVFVETESTVSEFISEDDSIIEVGSEDVTEITTHYIQKKITKNTVITLAVLLVMAIAATLILKIRSRAKNSEYSRQRRVDLILSDGFDRSVNDADKRKLAHLISDSIYLMLSIFGLTPNAGEFKHDFAKRSSVELIEIFGYPPGYTGPVEQGKKKNKKKTVDYPQSVVDFNEIFEALSAEEFGSGMSVEQMRAVALFDKQLHDNARKKLGFFTWFKLKYIKNII